MSGILTSRNISLIIGLIGAIGTITSYAPRQPAMLVVSLVFVGCWLFWAWLASLGISSVVWVHDEVVLMGRWPRVKWRPSPFKAAMLVARLLGLAAPFVIFYRGEGWAVLTNPERWALVPLTLAICIGVVAIPMWAIIMIIANKLKRAAS